MATKRKTTTKKATAKKVSSRKTTNKATSSEKKVNATIAKAIRILDKQKRDWKRIWKDNVSGLQNAKSGAKRASAEYKNKYGETRAKRWERALSEAKKS